MEMESSCNNGWVIPEVTSKVTNLTAEEDLWFRCGSQLMKLDNNNAAIEACKHE
jgi:hypothetical protein